MRLTSLCSILACACVLFVNQSASAQTDIKAIVVKHLTTSRDFTLKVAEQMPDNKKDQNDAGDRDDHFLAN